MPGRRESVNERAQPTTTWLVVVLLAAILSVSIVGVILVARVVRGMTAQRSPSSRIEDYLPADHGSGRFITDDRPTTRVRVEKRDGVLEVSIDGTSLTPGRGASVESAVRERLAVLVKERADGDAPRITIVAGIEISTEEIVRLVDAAVEAGVQDVMFESTLVPGSALDRLRKREGR